MRRVLPVGQDRANYQIPLGTDPISEGFVDGSAPVTSVGDRPPKVGFGDRLRQTSDWGPDPCCGLLESSNGDRPRQRPFGVFQLVDTEGSRFRGLSGFGPNPGWGQTPCWGIPKVCFAVRDRPLLACWTIWRFWRNPTRDRLPSLSLAPICARHRDRIDPFRISWCLRVPVGDRPLV